ncbi:MAG: hypothetical protein ACLFPE_07070 [Bacteroidales bacterium]
MKRAFLFIILFCAVSLVSGQVTIEGKVANTTGKPLSRINILVYHPVGDILIGFGVTDENGHYTTTVKHDADSLKIKLSAIQYRNIVKMVPNTSQRLDFETVQEEQELSGVTIKASAVEQRGDTLSFLVDRFSRKEDRTIEEVLRRIPGVEVEPSGRILYQGLPLEKFYVEGLDLTDGRYAVISQNLPQESVSTVEVMENHQPVKLLEDKVSSHRASMNLKLKKGVAATGTAEAGAGAAPLLWKVNFTPMFFTKNFQALTSYQSNNAGYDLSSKFNILTIEDLNSGADRPSKKYGLLSVLQLQNPQINTQRYLDNNVHLVNLNSLQKLNNDFQLRCNIHYLNDWQKEKSSLKQAIFTPYDTIEFLEMYDNSYFKNELRGDITLYKNAERQYFENTTSFKSGWNHDRGEIFPGNGSIQQTLDKPAFSLSNELQSLSAIGNQLMEFNSYLFYDHHPHQLKVKPGQFEAIINEGMSYGQSTQETDMTRIFADHSAGFIIGWKKFSLSPKTGFTYQQNTLESRLFATPENGQPASVPVFSNHLDEFYTNLYLRTEAQYKSGNFVLKGGIPLEWKRVKIEDRLSEIDQRLSGVYISPHVTADLKFYHFWRIRASWNYKNQPDHQRTPYYNYILLNYRNLNKNTAHIPVNRRHSISTKLAYNNAVTFVSGSLSYVYNIVHSNLLYSAEIDTAGATVRKALDMPNDTYSQGLYGHFSKFFLDAKSTLSLKISANIFKSQALINSNLFDTKTVFYQITPGLSVKVFSWLNTDYNFQSEFINTFTGDEERNAIVFLKHFLKVFAFPHHNQMVYLGAEYYELEGENNYFLDFSYRYTIGGTKTDLEFTWNNILNQKEYVSYSAGGSFVSEYIYRLRPSQVLLSVRFRF